MQQYATANEATTHYSVSICPRRVNIHSPNQHNPSQPRKLAGIHHTVTVATAGYPAGGKYPEEDGLYP